MAVQPNFSIIGEMLLVLFDEKTQAHLTLLFRPKVRRFLSFLKMVVVMINTGLTLELSTTLVSSRKWSVSEKSEKKM
jgi:hypothetical protein